MTPIGRKQDPDFVNFARRVGVVVGAVLAVMTLSQLLSAQVTRDLRLAIASETAQRVMADSVQTAKRADTDRRLDRMTAIMELVVLVESDQADPEQRADAIKNLRRMRTVFPEGLP